MRAKRFIILSAVVVVLIGAAAALSEETNGKHTLVINGKSTDVPLVRINGTAYVGLKALAAAINGTLSYSGNMAALSLPVAPAEGANAATSDIPSPATPITDSSSTSSAALSRKFLTAAIEQMSTLREWHTALASAIENGIPLSANVLAPYHGTAATNLRLAQAAARTPADKSAYRLLDNEFQNMGKLSDKYVNMRTNLAYIAPDALQNDDLNQRLVACGRSLGAMAASGQFVDEGVCR